jgi:hypothetical protein
MTLQKRERLWDTLTMDDEILRLLEPGEQDKGFGAQFREMTDKINTVMWHLAKAQDQLSLLRSSATAKALEEKKVTRLQQFRPSLYTTLMFSELVLSAPSTATAFARLSANDVKAPLVVDLDWVRPATTVLQENRELKEKVQFLQHQVRSERLDTQLYRMGAAAFLLSAASLAVWGIAGVAAPLHPVAAALVIPVSAAVMALAFLVKREGTNKS